MKWKKTVSASAIVSLLAFLMLFSSLTPLTTSVASNLQSMSAEDGGSLAPLSNGDMTFTSDDTINFYSAEEMTVSKGNMITISSGVVMNFSSTIKMQFIEAVPDGLLAPCDQLIVQWPAGYLPDQCSWWEVIDQSGKALGEFHVDYTIDPDIFHIDNVWPGSIVVPMGGLITAIRKIDIIEPCLYFEVHWPSDWWPTPCTWWEIIDPETGELTGFEFHVDWTNESCEFHIDEVFGPAGEPYYIPGWWFYEIQARQKIPGIAPCDYLVVEEPPEWYPEPCTWWEVLDPFSLERTGFEFHVDWTNESCEFHIDEVWPGPLMFPDPYGVPFFYAEEKITNITACDWFVIEDPIQAIPEPCSWWEVLDPAGDPTGLEFHIDISPGDGTFHVDQVSPDPLSIPWVPPTITITVRKKIDIIQPCDWFKVADPPAFLEPCSWWKIINPDVGDVEFHVDQVMPDGSFHIDDVIGDATMLPIHEVTAERKIDDIQPCDWFVVVNPPGFVPEPCSLWEIVWPSAWAGIVFHVDSNDGISSFHIDDTDASLPPPQLPPWNVTATPYEEPPPPWFKKPPYPDYAPSGMPDFDQKQDLWGPGVGIYTWCGPVSVANSLWWFDSKYDPSNIVPAFGPWDDHDPKNVDPLVQNLAFLMDTDGIRTHLMHMGTNFIDMETGISQYLQWQGINPMGDADGDGDVDDDDLLIIANAMQSTPGAPNWDMRADIVIDNVVDINDQNVAIANYGLVGAFYEHTEEYPDFLWIEDEIYRCEDVVLFLEFWQETGPGEWMPLYDNPSFEAGHYVTCAGVNSTTLELLISDPYWDATEAGFPGDIPVSHPYPHTTDIHNDTQYVSHDAYPVALRMDPPPLPYPVPMVWELVNYLQQLGYDPSWHAFIRAAIVTSPLAEPDIAVTNLTLCHGQTVCARNTSTWTHHINVTVTNEGTTAETFTLTVYWNTTNVIGSTSVSLAISETKIVEFSWNTTGYQLYANYTLSAYATPLPGETDQLDNTYIGPTVVVSFKGDVDADGDIDIYDVVKITGVYMSKLGDPNYKPNSDIDCNGVIDIYDVVKCTGNYNWKYTPSP